MSGSREFVPGSATKQVPQRGDQRGPRCFERKIMEEQAFES
jgi:hypothetical protein